MEQVKGRGGRRKELMMGEEADADWQADIGEWGDEDIRRWLAEKMDEALMKAAFGATRKQRKTALRVRGRSFETVELDDGGKIIEPPAPCCCGWGVLHSPNCKSWGIT